MKKTVIIFLLAIVFGLVGCDNTTKESVNKQPMETTTAANNEVNSKEKTTSNDNEKSSDNNKVISNDKSNNTNQESKKQEYKAKLDNIELGFKGSNDANATTNDMYQEACKEHKQWDDALNEIYGVLKSQLPASDMKKLQSEELQWIKDRDAKAKKDAEEMAGGTMEKVLFQGSLANSTKERCYVLVEKYMK
ncbi:lysozyme inhibitor LprI family protein [Clostridium chromiireducens]|uniref:lysozyme inhibitor LprI family protein n=1 Tax=Clostridium chromiireducens TaxID=225345 RepID=UPI003AF692C1